MSLVAPKLRQGDLIRVVAPSLSFSLMSGDARSIAMERFHTMGLRVSFGKHVEECDAFESSSIASRISDLHEAFQDPEVKAIFTVIGGYNCNQLLPFLDFSLVSKNPKIFCGYSDITALQNAILKKSGLVTYSGPHFSTFGMKKGFEHTLEYFKKCCFSEEPFEMIPSSAWSDNPWYENQEQRVFLPNPGVVVVNEGVAEGNLIGGNLGTLSLLQGTKFFPNLSNSILFLEEDDCLGELTAVNFDRLLQSLLQQPDFGGVKGILIGRFQKKSRLSNFQLGKILASKKELSHLPILANLDFGHTSPMVTLPVGGKLHLEATSKSTKISVLSH